MRVLKILFVFFFLYAGCGKEGDKVQTGRRDSLINVEKKTRKDSLEQPKVDSLPVVVGGIPIPVYPKEAIINKIEGIVYVKCYISKEGEITKVEIERNSTENKELGQSALESAKKIKFRPAKYADKYVDSWVIIPYNFKLK